MHNQSNHAARAASVAPRLLSLGPRAARMLRSLEGRGFACTHQNASEWGEFRLLAARGSFDVILADHDKIDPAVSLLSLRVSGIQTPVILITKRLPQEEAIAAIKAGAFDCVRRDDTTRLAATIEEALAHHARPRRSVATGGIPEARYHDLVESLDVVVFAIDPDGHISFISSAVENLSGYRRDELLNKPYLALVYPDDVPDLLAALERSLRGEVFPVEWRAIDKDGSPHLVYSVSRAVYADHHLVEVRGVLTAIDERRLGEVAPAPENVRPTAAGRDLDADAALAAVAEELLTALDTPIVLERLCPAARAALACDYVHTFRLEADRYTPVAGSGDTPELWQAMRLIRIPRHHLETADGQIALLEEIKDQAVSPWLPLHRVGAGLFVPLRRGDELVGYLTAGIRETHFAAPAVRVAGGIARLASLALNNARLVEDLETADRSRADFVANLSHELRTPLNVIIGYSDLLLDEAFGAVIAEQRDAMRRVGEQARELIDIVNTTLDLSRIEAGRVPLDVEPVVLAELLEEIECETNVAFADRAQVVFSWTVEDGLAALETDALKLKVVIKNLVTNAMKFTQSGSVTVSAGPRRGGVEIAVRDTGPGIARDQQSVIFEAFRQIGAARGAQKGVGLGLHIVQRLLVVLGGTIRVESELGHGSTFRVWLPPQAPQPSTARVP